jgi:hypothetical protein
MYCLPEFSVILSFQRLGLHACSRDNAWLTLVTPVLGPGIYGERTPPEAKMDTQLYGATP